jgi:hypothetical protein
LWNDMENMEERQWLGKYGRKASWIVKRYEKYVEIQVE